MMEPMPVGTNLVRPRAPRRLLLVAMIGGLTTGSALVAASATPAVAAAPAAAPARFVPVQPCRLLDTRAGTNPTIVPAGGTIDVQVVSDACQVPANATAAALTITVDDPDGSGYVTAWPAGSPRPEASVINYRAQEIVANSPLIQIGAGG